MTMLMARFRELGRQLLAVLGLIAAEETHTAFDSIDAWRRVIQQLRSLRSLQRKFATIGQYL